MNNTGNDQEIRRQMLEKLVTLCCQRPMSEVMDMLADIINDYNDYEFLKEPGRKEELLKTIYNLRDMSIQESQETGQSEEALFLAAMMQKAMNNAAGE